LDSSTSLTANASVANAQIETGEKILNVTGDYSNLEKNTQYLLAVVKDSSANDLFVADNLIYMQDAMSDDEGNLSFDYTPLLDDGENIEYLLFKRKTPIMLIEKNIQAEDITYDGEEHNVNLLVKHDKKPTPTPIVTPEPSITPTPSETPDTTIQETPPVSIETTVKLKKVSSLKLTTKKKSFKAKWKKISDCDGYQIQYAINKKFKNKKSKNTKKTSIIIKKLKKKKTYYVRVRAYKLNGKEKNYGKWSQVKKIKIKK